MTSPIIVGLIGGIASGKSTVARMLQARGGLWIDSDRMAHEELNSPDVIAQVRQRFGDEVIADSGHVDRARLAALVFGDDHSAAGNKHWLEQLIHPRVRQRTHQQIDAARERYPFVIIDAPLLIEAGWVGSCDRVLMVDAPLDMRQRWAASRGWNMEELAKREASQLPLEEKKRRATDVITNGGSLAELEAQIDQFCHEMLNRVRRKD